MIISPLKLNLLDNCCTWTPVSQQIPSNVLFHKVVLLSFELPCQMLLYPTPTTHALGSKPKRTLPVVTDATVLVTTSNPIPFTQTIQSSNVVTVPTQSGMV